MAAITWRTLMGASPSEASRGFESAQRSITGAFDQLGGLIKGAEAFNQKQADTEAEGRVQGFLDRIQGARTPEDVAALQASGELDTLRAALKPADLARVRGAEEARTTALRQGIVAQNTFDDQVKARTFAPIKDKALALSMSGDKAGALALLAQNPDMPGQADIQRAITTDDQSRMRWDQDKKKWSWDEAANAHAVTLRPLDVAERKSSIEANKATLAAAAEDRALAKEAREAAKVVAGITAKEQAMREEGNPYAIDGVYSSGRTEEATKMMVDNGIGDSSDARGAMLKKVEEVAAKHGPLPMAVVKQALLGASGGWYFKTDSEYADNVGKILDKALEQQRAVELASGKSGDVNSLAAYHKQWTENRKAAVDNPAPVTSKKR